MHSLGLRVFPLARVIAVVGAALLGGCTAGQVVDPSFAPLPIANGSFKFVAVDGSGKPTGAEYAYDFAGDRSENGADVVFDYFAPDTSAQASGIRNSRQSIAEGRYYVDLSISPNSSSGAGGGGGFAGSEYRSGIFDHEYSGSCNDYYTGKTDPYCVQYYFQVSYSANCVEQPTTCCRGDQGCVTPTPLPTHSGVKVITLYGGDL